jgi:hypothetical protein
MSVLDRYLNTEKYQGVMRELAIAQILNEKTKPGLFIKQNALDRCGFTGDADDFPNAEADYEHVFNTGDTEKGMFFKTPRMLIIHGGNPKDTTFIENSKNKGEIVGIYPQDNYLYDDWEEKNPGQPCPYKRRRLILMYLVNEDGVAAHKKPLILSLHGGASREFVTAYGRFLEQLEGAFSDKYNLKSATGFDPKQAAAAIFTPTFGTVMYGEKQKSAIAVPKTWKEPTAKNLEEFFPKKGDDIDYIEDVYESVTMEVYCAKFFKQCEKEIGINALAPGVDLTNLTLPLPEGSGGIRGLLAARDETGAIEGGLK